MNPSLLRLQFLLTKATLRRLLRGARTVRGALLLLFTLGLTGMGIAPSLLMIAMNRQSPEILDFMATAESILPGILLILWLMLLLTSAGEFSLFFSPAEIDFLFPAPFHRRDLVLYKLSKTAQGLLLMSFFFTLYFLPALRSWISGFVGIFLSLAFMNLAGMVLTLAGQIVSTHAFNTGRKAILLVVASLAAAALLQVNAGGLAGRNLLEIAEGLRGSVPGRILLAPFEVLSRTICSSGIQGGLLRWGLTSLAMNAALLALVFRLDADYLEAAAAISGKIHERTLRTKQGGGMAVSASSSSIRLKPSLFPWLGGTGPIAWRQIVLTLRRSRIQIIVSVLLATIFFVTIRPGEAAAEGIPVTLALLSGLLYLTFLLTMQAPWGFRGDLDHLEGFKTLPIRPISLVIGELSGGVILLTLIQVVILGIALLILPVKASLILAAMAFAAPLNTTLIGVNNLLFLYYPFRVAKGTTMDAQEVGRALVFTILQGMLLGPTFGIPTAIGIIAYLAGASLGICAGLSWVVLLAELPVLLWVTGRAFEHFDPGTQTPA